MLGALVVGLPFGIFAGTLIDRVGARGVILSGIGLIGLPLILMGRMAHFWQYELLCIAEVIGYTLAGPIANQVLIAQWFRVRRGQAMGYAYLGLGLGGVVSPLAANFLIRSFGWRIALEIAGTLMLAVLFPVGVWVTRSTPAEMGLVPDGANSDAKPADENQAERSGVATAIRTADFWLILAGATLILSSVNAVIQHFILFLKDQGYSIRSASHFLSALLVASLAGRVLVGYIADRFQKKNTMALFYLVLGASIPLLYLARQPLAAFAFADYVWILHGRRLHADSAGDGGPFRTGIPGKAAGPDHHGLHNRPVDRALDGGKDFRHLPQLSDWPGRSLPVRACWVRRQFMRCPRRQFLPQDSLGARRNEPKSSSTGAPVDYPWRQFAPEPALRLRSLFVMDTTLNPAAQLYCTTHPSMGTEYSLYLYAPSREEAAAIAKPVFQEVDRVDALLSNYRPDSELSRINREAFDHEVTTDPETFRFLATCLAWSERSQGAFDISVGKLMKVWKFFGASGALPSPEELAAARADVGWENIRLDPAAAHGSLPLCRN